MRLAHCRAQLLGAQAATAHGWAAGQPRRSDAASAAAAATPWVSRGRTVAAQAGAARQQRGADDDAGEGATLLAKFERAAEHERKHDFTNTSGRQFANFGLFLRHSLATAAALRGAPRTPALDEALLDVGRYAELSPTARQALVVRACSWKGALSRSTAGS